MKAAILTLSLIFFSLLSYAQKQGNIWYFGNHAGLDFNTTPPTFLLNGQTDFPLPNQWNEGCSSISDSSGNLLFYTNGEKIWNKLHQIMPNGNNLMGHSSSTQSSVIVHQPGSNRFFYVFTTDASENDFQNGLRYNMVDICLDNELGDIIASEKNIKLTDTVTEKLICIPHNNGSDYWIITHQNNSDAFYTFRLTSSGIVDTIISHTGTFDMNGTYATGGQMIASPNGLKIAYAKPSGIDGFTLLLDFDPSSGIVSNPQPLNTLNTEYGVSFSSDNSKLYFSTVGHGEIYQYDLNAGNLLAIIASKTHILQNGPDGFGCLQLAINEKIYISRAGKEYLSVINSPNSLGVSCDYVDSAIYLGGQYASFGLPNFIAGYKYQNQLACTEYVPIEPPTEELIIPNIFTPNADNINDTFIIKNLPANSTVQIYNRWGALVSEWANPNCSWDGRTKSGAEVSAGIYYYIVSLPNNERKKGFVEVIR